MELPAVFAKGLLRLHGADVELAESVFSSDDTGTFTPCMLWFVMNAGSVFFLAPSNVWINAARRWCDIGLCAG